MDRAQERIVRECLENIMENQRLAKTQRFAETQRNDAEARRHRFADDYHIELRPRGLGEIGTRAEARQHRFASDDNMDYIIQPLADKILTLVERQLEGRRSRRHECDRCEGRPSTETTSSATEERQAALGRLQTQLDGLKISQSPLKFNPSEDYVYTITIISENDCETEPGHTLARATLDTGCHDNWVSMAVLMRGKLDGKIMEFIDDQAEESISFSGHSMRPQGTIDLTWFMATPSANGQRTKSDSFYVFDGLPVDIVLGRAFVQKEFIFVSKYALGQVKQGKFTPGENDRLRRVRKRLTFTDELRQIEISMKEKDVSNEEISSFRSAVSSSARDARRQKKAASQATSRGANTPYSTFSAPLAQTESSSLDTPSDSVSLSLNAQSSRTSVTDETIQKGDGQETPEIDPTASNLKPSELTTRT